MGNCFQFNVKAKKRDLQQCSRNYPVAAVKQPLLFCLFCFFWAAVGAYKCVQMCFHKKRLEVAIWASQHQVKKKKKAKCSFKGWIMISCCNTTLKSILETWAHNILLWWKHLNNIVQCQMWFCNSGFVTHQTWPRANVDSWMAENMHILYIYFSFLQSRCLQMFYRRIWQKKPRQALK